MELTRLLVAPPQPTCLPFAVLLRHLGSANIEYYGDIPIWDCTGMPPVASGRAARKLLCGGGGGGMAWAPGEGGGGGVPEMGFCAGPFVLCKDGCCRQRRRNTNFGLENFFHEKMFPHICVVKMISATWGSFRAMYVGVGPPPPPGTAGRAAPAHTPLPARRPRRGRGGVRQMGFRAIPPLQSNFLPAKCTFVLSGAGMVVSTAWQAPGAGPLRIREDKAGGRDASERVSSLCPATVTLTAAASFSGTCNRQ